MAHPWKLLWAVIRREDGRLVRLDENGAHGVLPNGRAWDGTMRPPSGPDIDDATETLFGGDT
jgi:hypothetical protein